jgi:hypothetical protein
MGGAVFTGWKGINVLKTKPLTVANPQTPGQRQQRNTLRACLDVYRLISGAINYGFKQAAVKKSEYNAFMSVNMKNAVIVTDPDNVAINPALILVSNGSLGTTTMSTVVADESSSDVVITYPTTTPIAGQSPTDIPHAVLFNSDTAQWEYLGPNATRTAGTATFAVTIPITAADSCRVYVFFVSADGNKSSVNTNTVAVVQA